MQTAFLVKYVHDGRSLYTPVKTLPFSTLSTVKVPSSVILNVSCFRRIRTPSFLPFDVDDRLIPFVQLLTQWSCYISYIFVPTTILRQSSVQCRVVPLILHSKIGLLYWVPQMRNWPTTFWSDTEKVAQ